jgi:hypothetical protein
MSEKMTWDQANAIEAWQTVERKEERIEELSRVLLDVEGSLLAYWTDISQEEIERLLPLIRETLGDYEPRAANSQQMCVLSTPSEPVICDRGCGLAACPRATNSQTRPKT